MCLKIAETCPIVIANNRYGPEPWAPRAVCVRVEKYELWGTILHNREYTISNLKKINEFFNIMEQFMEQLQNK